MASQYLAEGETKEGYPPGYITVGNLTYRTPLFNEVSLITYVDCYFINAINKPAKPTAGTVSPSIITQLAPDGKTASFQNRILEPRLESIDQTTGVATYSDPDADFDAEYFTAFPTARSESIKFEGPAIQGIINLLLLEGVEAVKVVFTTT